MKVLRAHLVLPFLVALAAGPAPAADGAREVIPLRDGERVVHLAGSVYTHAYCEPKLEALLLKAGAARGLVYRQVRVGPLSDLLKTLDVQVLAHKPTLVIFQAGSDDLFRQSRRQNLDFAAFPRQLDELAQRLATGGARLVICSVPPVGNGSSPQHLVAPNDGLKTWVDAAREVAAKRQAFFVDLFTEALEWPMIGNNPLSRFYYPPEGYDRSLQLLLKQVTFGSVESPTLPTLPPDLKAELEKGHELTATLHGIRSFVLPPWVRVADFDRQRDGAEKRVLDALAAHDAAVRRMLDPRP